MTESLLVILYVLGSILLTVLIILGIKLIGTVNKINKLVDDINGKVASLNGLFNIIDYLTDRLATISDRLAETVASLIKKIFQKKESEELSDE